VIEGVKMIYEQIYSKIDDLTGGIEDFLKKEDGYMELKSKGFMDLNVDRLDEDRIAMAHNYIQNGDVMADPDMEIRIDVKRKVAEALTFQQDSLGIYQVVYPEPGKVNPMLKKELNLFLNYWLDNLEKQGFYKRRR